LSQILRIDQLVDEQRFGRFNLSLLFWCFLAMFADGYDIGALSYAQPELQKLWHIPPNGFGIVASASLFGILFGAPLLGLWGDRRGRRSAIIAGSVIYGLSSLAVAWSHSLLQVEVLRFITGVGLGGLMPNTIALNSELAPKRMRATLVTLMFSGITLGGGGAGLVAAELMPRFGWTVIFVIGGLAPLLIAGCLAFVLPESVKYLVTRPERRDELLGTLRRMRPDLALSPDTRFSSELSSSAGGLAGVGQIFAGGLAVITPLLWICFATALMSNFFLNSFLPLIFRNSGMPADQAALAATLYHIGGTVGGVLMAMLLDRFGFLMVALLFAVAAPAIAALGAVPTTFGTLAPLASLAGLAVLGAQFGNNAAAGLLYPTATRAKGVGLALGVGRFGAITGPLIGGHLIGLPLHQLFLIAAAPMVVGAVAAGFVTWRCFVRLGGLRLGDVPVTMGAAGIPPTGTMAELPAEE
jgi:MFS transporter, AAHS family, 4-hydroxybenzoate transporter